MQKYNNEDPIQQWESLRLYLIKWIEKNQEKWFYRKIYFDKNIINLLKIKCPICDKDVNDI